MNPFNLCYFFSYLFLTLSAPGVKEKVTHIICVTFLWTPVVEGLNNKIYLFKIHNLAFWKVLIFIALAFLLTF